MQRVYAEGVLTYRVNVVLLTVYVYKDYTVVIRLYYRIHTYTRIDDTIYYYYIMYIYVEPETGKFDLRVIFTHTLSHYIIYKYNISSRDTLYMVLT